MKITMDNLCPKHRNTIGKMGNVSKDMSSWTLLLLTALLCLVPTVSSQGLKFHRNSVEMKQAATASEPLSLLWGIADTTAYVGKLFTYTLPNDAFQGNIVHYDITEVGKDSLPSWCTFNPLKTELKGIPGPQNKGQIYLEVVATGDDNSHATDVFSIEILEDTFASSPFTPSKHASANTPKPVRCKREEPQTITTVLIDSDLDLMKGSDKINLIDNLVSHLNLAPEYLKLMPVGDKPMFDSNALVVGPGNIKEPQYVGSMVSWLVGCGQVQPDHMPILQLVEASAASGDMKGALGHNIIGWHVTNTRFQEKVRRKRAVATATPTPTMPSPTQMIATSKPVIEASATVIMPTKTVEVQPTKSVVNPTEKATTSSTPIATSQKFTDKTLEPTAKATEILPTKTYTMTSEVMTETDIIATTTVTTTTTKTTPMPTTKPTTPSTTTEKITTKKMTPKPTTEKPRKPKPTTPYSYCPPLRSSTQKEPLLENPLKDISLHSGAIKRVKIPDDTFFDCYADSTSELDVEIKLDNGDDLPAGYWMTLQQKGSKPYNLLTNPLNTDAGKHGFKLMATNTKGLSVSQRFNIIVLGEDMTDEPPNHEVSMTIDTDYDEFMSDMNNRIELSNKIASVFGDKNSKLMTITRLERGSVVFAWTNNSLSGGGCPVGAVTENLNKLMGPNGKISPEAQDALAPYTIGSAASVPLGSCTNNPDFPVRSFSIDPKTTPSAQTPKPTTTEEPTMKPKKETDSPIITDKPEEKSTPTKSPTESSTKAKVAAAGAGGGGSDIWITTVVPAIVVVIVLIIALIIACCLYRKKRKGKMKLQEQNSFSNNKKGVPVIFADEYDEKPNDSSRPLIMDEEKPPMPPPEYQRASSETSGNSGNSNSTQPYEDKYAEEIEMDTDVTSPLYSPPPPVTASNNSKPPHVQSNRGPPPYVPP